MKKLMIIFRAVYLASFLTLLVAGVAEAHDCSSPGDCEQTAGYNGALAVSGAVIAIVTAVTASQLGSTLATTVSGVFGPGTSGEPGGPPDLFPPTPPTLYDLRDDPTEMTNVAERHPELVKELHKRLVERFAKK